MFEPEPWHPDRPGVFRPGRLDPTGEAGPTRSEAQGDDVRRTSYGCYLPVWVERTTDQRIVEASLVRGRPLVVTGWAALRWRGATWSTGLRPDGSERPVPVLTNTRDLRPRDGVAWSGEGVGGHHREVVDGLLVADVRAAVSFEMRYAASVWTAVRVLDMAAYDDLVSIEEMARFIVGQSSWTGVPRARQALPWASESAWSPPEVDMRLLWGPRSGRPMPLANQPVFDAVTGAHVATPDLIDPVWGVVGEYESELHLERGVRHRDVGREGVLREYGLEPVTMVTDDRGDPRSFLARLGAAYRRAARVDRAARRWTIEPPSWWTPTTTVAERRALTPDQRRRFLRYRAS